jgi:hypothetical protein
MMKFHILSFSFLFYGDLSISFYKGKSLKIMKFGKK